MSNAAVKSPFLDINEAAVYVKLRPNKQKMKKNKSLFDRSV